jgi:hypothetical protein
LVELLGRLSPESRTQHNHFLQLCDKHFAHSVSNYEHAYAVVWIEQLEEGGIERGSIGAGGFFIHNTTIERMRELKALASLLIRLAEELQGKYSETLQNYVVSLSDEELVALGVPSDDFSLSHKARSPRSNPRRTS